MCTVGETVAKGRGRKDIFNIDPAYFRAVVDYLDKLKITPTGSNLRKTHIGNDDDIVLQQLLLAFVLECEGIIHYEKSVEKSKVRGNKLVT